MIKNYVKKNKKDCIYFKSLGQRVYFSFVNNCDLVLGNSSSGIIEVPFFKKPSINVGDRQLGRIKCKSTINVDANCLKILQSVKKVLSKSFFKNMSKIKNQYQKKDTSKKIFKTILNLKSKNLLIKKFYDL